MRVDIYNIVLNQQFVKNGFQRKKKNQQEKQLSQLNETFNDVNIGNVANVNIMENETSEQQTNGQHNGFERFIDSASQNQVIETNIDDKITIALDNAISIVEKYMHDAILAAMDQNGYPKGWDGREVNHRFIRTWTQKWGPKPW